MQQLIELEEQGWQALSSTGEVAKEFYGALLADNALMLFPGGLLIEGKEDILGSIAAQPWHSFRIEETHTIQLSESVGLIAYRVTARREDRDAYEALISSIYVLRDGQ
jgi:hypothetical protein